MSDAWADLNPMTTPLKPCPYCDHEHDESSAPPLSGRLETVATGAIAALRDLEEQARQAEQAAVRTGNVPTDMTLYAERAAVVAALLRVAPSLGCAAGVVPASEAEWMSAYIDTPEGQLAWHVSEDDKGLFKGIPAYTGDNTQTYTTSEKYRRLGAWSRRVAAKRREVPAAGRGFPLEGPR